MRVTFPRLPDHEKAYAVIERDDGVVYRLYGGLAGTTLPHDVRHLVVERTLGIRDGLWGEIASGAVFLSMRHVSGRRPPQAAARSVSRKQQFRSSGRWLHAEMVANLAERVAGLPSPTTAEIQRLAASVLSMLPDNGTDVDPDAVAAAARALQVEASRWARLRPGEQLVYDWPASPRVPRQRRPGK
jgi:hypothetical protein